MTTTKPNQQSLKQTPRLCPQCNYDLRANTNNQCPECGHTYNPNDLKSTNPIPWRHILPRLIIPPILLPFGLIAAGSPSLFNTFLILSLGYWIISTALASKHIARRVTNRSKLDTFDPNTFALSVVFTVLLCVCQAILLVTALFGACACIMQGFHI